MNNNQTIIFVIFLLIAFAVFMFPLIISLITKNYWYFLLFFVSWIPAFVIGKIGGAITDD